MVKHTQIIRLVLPTNCLSVFECVFKTENFKKTEYLFSLSQMLLLFPLIRISVCVCLGGEHSAVCLCVCMCVSVLPYTPTQESYSLI